MDSRNCASVARLLFSSSWSCTSSAFKRRTRMMYSSGGIPSCSSWGNRSARLKNSSLVASRSLNLRRFMNRQTGASGSAGSIPSVKSLTGTVGVAFEFC